MEIRTKSIKTRDLISEMDCKLSLFINKNTPMLCENNGEMYLFSSVLESIVFIGLKFASPFHTI